MCKAPYKIIIAVGYGSPSPQVIQQLIVDKNGPNILFELSRGLNRYFLRHFMIYCLKLCKLDDQSRCSYDK
jgi:hypothetical protein